jgi:hypothetical protein
MRSVSSRPGRQQWLMQAMRDTWRELNDSAPAGSPDYLAWPRSLQNLLTDLPHDCVVFTHLIAINAAVAAAHSRDDVVCFRPDHASITCGEAQSGILRLIELRREAGTTVLARA